MESPIGKPKIYSRKFWLPVGFFSLILLPLFLCLKIKQEAESRKEYCFVLTSPRNSLIEGWYYRPLYLDFSNIEDFKSADFHIKIKQIYDQLNSNSVNNISELNLKLPEKISYDDVFNIFTLLEKKEISCDFDLDSSKIILYPSFTIFPEFYLNKCGIHAEVAEKENAFNFTWRNFIVLGFCFPFLVFFNLRNLLRLYRRRLFFKI